MNNLLHADLMRIFKSRTFYLGLVFSPIFALITIFLEYINAGIMLQVPAWPLAILPMATAAYVGLYIAPEFTQGTMRNKIIIGHTHENIYLAALMSLSVVTLIYYAVYEIVAFTVGAAVLEITGISWKATVTILLLMAILLVSNTAVSLLVCMVIHDHKSIVLVLLLQYALMFLGIGLEALADSEMSRFISKLVPQGYFPYFNIYEMPDKLWQPVLLSIVVGTAVTLLGIYNFKNNDMK